MEVFSFGDSPEMADALLDLVLRGRKTATSWEASHGSLESEVGQRQMIKDSQGRPRALIETTELGCRLFSEVDESFARDEGEGDLSLDYWRKEHKAYFARQGSFSEDMRIYCQRFKVVEIIPL